MKNKDLNNKALSLISENNITESIELLMNNHEIVSRDFTLSRLLAFAFFSNYQYERAILILRQLVEQKPQAIDLYVDMASCLYALDMHDECIATSLKGLEIEPKNPELLRGYAILLKTIGDTDQAIQMLKDLIELKPDDVESYKILGNIYSNVLSEGDNAKECFLNILKIDPNNFKARLRICDIQTRSATGSEGDNIEEAYELAKNFDDIPSKICFPAAQFILLKVLDFNGLKRFGAFKDMMKILSENEALLPMVLSMSRVNSMQDRLDLVQAFKEWGNFHRKQRINNIVKKPRVKTSTKVRLGIVSTEMNDCHVFHFIRPILEHLDKRKFELFSYSLSPENIEDSTHETVITNSDTYKFYNLQEPDSKIAQDISDDQLDVLLETGVGFIKPKLTLFKAAPLQISWLDCPHSTALDTDYIIVDPYINPGDEFIIDKPMQLANSWVVIDEARFKNSTYRDDDSIPQDKNGCITFGSLNSPFKLTAETFRVWAGIMKRVPGSRFLYVRPETASRTLQHNFCKYMEQYDIDPNRISFIATRLEHLNQYHKIDIALDVFPHTGGTTTCECLWMGVPTVTLVGTCFFERLSYSNLCNAGLSDLCAFTIKQYQDIAVNLANDPQRRRHLKKNLRKQIMQHPLGKPEQFVRDFEEAIVKIL